MLKRPGPIFEEVVHDKPKRGRKRKVADNLDAEENWWNPTTVDVQQGFLYHFEVSN